MDKKSLTGYSPWDHEESDAREQLTHTDEEDESMREKMESWVPGDSGKKPGGAFHESVNWDGLVDEILCFSFFSIID